MKIQPREDESIQPADPGGQADALTGAVRSGSGIGSGSGSGQAAPAGHSVVLAGEAMLLVGSCVYLGDRQTLCVADLHLGKGLYLQQRGLAVPSAHDAADLDRLLNLASSLQAQRIVLLGDVVHGALGRSEALAAVLAARRDALRGFEWIAVTGNHDRHAGSAAVFPDWHWVAQWSEGKLYGTHEPARSRGSGLNLCGHLHPGMTVRFGRERFRGPVYWYRRAMEQLILPAFGALTGTMQVKPAAEDLCFLAGTDRVLPIPGTLKGGRGRRKLPV